MLLKWFRRARKEGERGQALTEFALVAPILLLLLVGVVEIGNGLNAYLTVVDTARDGARLGSKGSASDSEIKGLVQTEIDRLPAGVDPDNDITVERDVVPGRSSLRVTVCYDYPLILGVPLFIPDPLRMCSATTMPTLDVQ